VATPEEAFERYVERITPEKLAELKGQILKEQLEGHDEHEKKLVNLFNRLERDKDSKLTVTEEEWG
jgi:hypothetical protein